MQRLDARQRVQHFTREVRAAAVAGGTETQLIGFGFRQRHQRLHRFNRQRRVRHQQIGRHTQQRNRREVTHQIVRQLGIQTRVHRQLRGEGKHQCVTVRRRFRHRVHADVAARPTAIFDHHQLPHAGARQLRQRPRNDVGAAPRRVRQHQADGFGRVRVRLRLCVRRRHCQHRRQRQVQE